MQPPLQPAAIDLLEALQANQDFTTLKPSSEFLTFLHRIESADPAAFADPDNEDNTNESWGHYQYTSGSLTCSVIISTWSNVGSPEFACKLIAAALKTCQVARRLCKERTPQPSFLSDNYLNEIVELLWSCWKLAGGVSGIAFLIQSPN